MSEKLQSNKFLLIEIKGLIEESRRQLAIEVNTAMSLLYWNIGNRIHHEILKNNRAGYGDRIVKTLSAQLTAEYGRGFSEKNLRRMIQFAAVFPEEEKVVSLIRQLSWTHILALKPIDDLLKRTFYIEMCKLEKLHRAIAIAHNRLSEDSREN